MNEIKNRQTFDRQIRKLLDDLLILGNMVEQAVLRAVAAPLMYPGTPFIPSGP